MTRAIGDDGGGLDAGAFTAAVVAHTPALYRFARRLERNPSSAEDLVQDTFLRAYQARGSFRGDASVVSWLRRIMHNVAVDQARRPQRELLVDEVEDRWRDDGYSVDPSVVLERAEIREELEDGLARLPFIYRTAVVLHDAEGWTVQEIADTVGIELPAAKQRLRRGRMLLVTALASGAERRAALEGVPMRRWDARQLVSDYLDDLLGERQRGLLEEHLRRCPTCPPLYRALVGVRERVGSMHDPDTVVPPSLVERICTQLGAPPPPRS